ncbi:hypothetical protein [Microtetraspora malaysiensis]|uniref:hypothetical protein n=1 Tax=Microtetraspora malaysiensis TaxID=161358 RepID=UPI000830A071|nr:hypothetical protein [Microtetraspora malaysiensis]
MTTTTRPAARVPVRSAITALAIGAIGALGTTGAIGAAASPAAASARPAAHAHDSIRNVSVKGCRDKTYGQVPCGPWRLAMHSGKTVTFTDALVWPRDAKGKTYTDTAAPIAVSGDGHSLAYFRKSDNRLVVREMGGAVHVMPELKGRSVTAPMDLILSQDGRRLLVGYYGTDGERRPYRVYDVSDPGQGATLPKTLANASLSGDGATVLGEIVTDENTRTLATYDASGSEMSRVEPPQVVVNNSPYALSSDGRTVAVVTGSGGGARLKLYDMVEDRMVRSLRVKLPAGGTPYMLDWTGDRQVTMHVDRGHTMWIGQFDSETGAGKVRDTYAKPKDAFVFAACGG